MKNNQNQKGIISIIAMLIGIFALGLVAITARGVAQQYTLNNDNVSTYQAFYAAESGAEEGAYQFVHAPDESPYTGGTLAILINDTSAEITVTSLPFSAAIINGGASKNDNSRQVFYHVLKYPDGPAFSYGLYTPHIVEVSGNVTVNGNVFAADGVNPEGDPLGSAEINGDIVDDQIPYPPQIESGPYYNAAILGGTFLDNANNAEAYLEEAAGEVTAFVYVDNAEKMDLQYANLRGTLWVTGDLKITGGTFNSVEPYVVIVVEGDLEIVGNVVINGIVYVKGNTKIGAGTVEIFGSLICVGDMSVIDISGNITVTYDPNIVNFWEDLVGSSHPYPPKIDRWDER